MGLKLEEDIKESYLSRFVDDVFNVVREPKKVKPGRWDHCQAIDRYTAAKYIEYFVRKYLEAPNQIKYGEIACILWVMIWCAQEAPGFAYEQDVVNLSCADVDFDQMTIRIRQKDISISEGLINLLKCLCESNTGQQIQNLFKIVSIKMLGRELAKASAELLGRKC